MSVIPVVYIHNSKAVCVDKDDIKVIGRAREVARSYALLGRIVIVDANESFGEGNDNIEIVKGIIKSLPYGCEITVNARSVEKALDLLDIGAFKASILPQDVTLEDLKQIPKDRVVLRLESVDDLKAQIEGTSEVDLTEFATEFTVMQISEIQGKPNGIGEETLDIIESVSDQAKEKGITISIAGGIASIDDIINLDRLGAHSIVGNALCSGKLELHELITAFLKTDRPDGLYRTVVVDEQGTALGLVFSDDESVKAAISKRRGIYHSRKRGLWEKGLESGHVQDLLRVDLDCDRDALRYTVRQHGSGFCHLNRWNCWTPDSGLGKLFRTLKDRKEKNTSGSYTIKLFNNPTLLAAKLREEAEELIDAKDKQDIAWECADVIYFASVICANSDVGLSDVEAQLDRRSKRIRRRAGKAKPGFTESRWKSEEVKGENITETKVEAKPEENEEKGFPIQPKLVRTKTYTENVERWRQSFFVQGVAALVVFSFLQICAWKYDSWAGLLDYIFVSQTSPHSLRNVSMGFMSLFVLNFWCYYQKFYNSSWLVTTVLNLTFIVQYLIEAFYYKTINRLLAVGFPAIFVLNIFFGIRVLLRRQKPHQE